MSVLINSSTKKQIAAFAANPSHALLLTGEASSGKLALAKQIISKLLVKVTPANTLVIDESDGSTSIDEVRSVKHFLKLKAFGEQTIRRAVIINNADGMGHEAQNALLKVLEEPPADTLIILCTKSKNELLPTISSRCMQIKVLPVTLMQAQEYYEAQGYTPEQIKKGWLLSRGRISMLDALVRGHDTSELLAQIELAKQVLKKPPYERLVDINDLAKQDDLEPFLQATATILRSVLEQSISGNKTGTKQLISKLAAVQNSIESLKAAPNKKLLLTNLFLNI